ncbi:MAG: oligosaccharide flippase family protein [Candidatus Thermoplasmatota archaeon]|nr:oligosaccharide flippase family protein [Candidatus Thermoplasmatota archaeon]
MGLRQKTAANIGWTALSQALAVGTNSAVLLILANIITPDDFGLFAACATITMISGQLATLGLDYAVINSKEEWRKVVATGSILRIALSVLAFALIALFSSPISQYFGIADLQVPLIVAATSLLVLALAFPLQMNLTKNLRFKQLSLARIAYSLTWSVTSLSLAIVGFSYWSLIIGMVLGQLVSLGVLLRCSDKWIGSSYQKQTAKNLFKFGSVATFGTIAVLLSSTVDKIIVGGTSGQVELGIYYYMYLFGTIVPSLLTGVINSVMFPTYTVLVNRPEVLRKAYGDTLRIVSEFSSLVSFGLAGGSMIFVSVLLGANWEAGITSLSFLALAGLFIAITSPAGNVFLAVGRPELVYRITFAVVIPEIPMMVLAADIWGMTGVSAVVMAFEGVKCLYVMHKTARIVGQHGRDIAYEILPFLFSGGVSGLVALMISWYLGLSLLTLILAASAVVVVFLALGSVLSKGRLLEDLRDVKQVLFRRAEDSTG